MDIMTTQMIISLFTLIIYLIIIFVFNRAWIKYAVGKVGTCDGVPALYCRLCHHFRQFCEPGNFRNHPGAFPNSGPLVSGLWWVKGSKFLNKQLYRENNENRLFLPFVFFALRLKSARVRLIKAFKSVTILSFSLELFWYLLI